MNAITSYHVPIALRQVGGSLYLRVPAGFVRANKLRSGDYVVFDPARLKVLRPGDFALVGRDPEPEPAE